MPNSLQLISFSEEYLFSSISVKCLVFHIDFLLTTYFTKDNRVCAEKIIYYTESVSFVYDLRTSSVLLLPIVNQFLVALTPLV